MGSPRQVKINKASRNLQEAIALYKKRSQGSDLPFLTLCKTLEVLFEYVWKELRAAVEEEGLFATSPKESIRQAATIGRLKNLERWIAIATARNDSVHNYFGIPEKDYVALAEEFLDLLKQVDWG